MQIKNESALSQKSWVVPTNIPETEKKNPNDFFATEANRIGANIHEYNEREDKTEDETNVTEEVNMITFPSSIH